MAEHTSNNKRIAKNTLMLYIRMFFIMTVGLYTSRMILKSLGVSDFGVFNVVGGFVSMLSFLNAVLVDASQRFISFSLGQNNIERLKKVFCTSVTAQFCLALIILFVAETFGLWFVNNKLVIDPSRIIAANWVYQCSIISLVATIINISHRSCIVAHEHMHVYAIISIFEAVLKLLIVFLLTVIPADKLIVYALLHLFVSLLIPIWFTVYCRKNFPECKYDFTFDKPLFKEMMSFSCWVLIGNLGFSFKDQFSNVIMNLFLGATINAARGVTSQLNGLITTFANNFFLALSPQITKQYAIGDIQRSQQLVYAGARYSFYMMMLLIIPIIINVDNVLHLWLGVVPEYSSEFVVITLIASLFYSMSKSLTTALQATGDIKAFQIGVAIIMLSELPFTYYLLSLEYNPYIALLPSILTNFIALYYRFYLLHKVDSIYSYKHFSLNIVLKSVILFCICLVLSFLVKRMFLDNLTGFILSSIISVTITLTAIFFVGMSYPERTTVIKFFLSKIKSR